MEPVTKNEQLLQYLFAPRDLHSICFPVTQICNLMVLGSQLSISRWAFPGSTNLQEPEFEGGVPELVACGMFVSARLCYQNVLQRGIQILLSLLMR